MNPFLLKGYHSPKYFCNRKEESGTLISAIRNSQDIILFGYRRLGKSALIHHIFENLNKEITCIYSDIWGTTNIDEFVKELANSIIKSTIFSKRKFSEKMSRFLQSIGASFQIGMDGLPSVNLILNDKAQIFKGLEELFGFLKKLDHPIVIAIDEFQEIKKYDNNIPFEGKLRALVQQCNNVNFIFSGSEYHLLNDIFNDYQKPFYQSTRMLSIDKIERSDYKSFILKHFNNSGKNIDSQIIDYILDITHLHTFYVQAVFNFLYGCDNLPNSIDEFETLYQDYISEKGVFYHELPNRLTKQQFAVVKAFGRTGLVSSPTSSGFMELAKTKNSSSMYRVINSLLEKQVIIKDSEEYRLYDVFLEHYIKRNL